MNNFGNMLRQMRLASGLSQRRLALQIGINPSHLSRIESGQKNPPKRSTVEKIVKVLGLSNERAKQLVEAAGYSFESRRRSVSFGSPLQPDGIDGRDDIWLHLQSLKGMPREAAMGVIDLVRDQDLTPAQRRSISKQLLTFVKALRLMTTGKDTKG